MSIEEIKQRLTILQVLAHYGIEVGRNNMIACPFHEDKKPSMKVYPETNTVYCFAGSCAVESLDVIDFIMLSEAKSRHQAGQMTKISKHEAILKAKSLITGTNYTASKHTIGKPTSMERQNLTKQFITYRTALKKHKAAQDYCESRGLNWRTLEIGYKSRRSPDRWGRGCIIFALRDAMGNIVGLYGRGITGSSHFYQTDRKGLYPHYPNPKTKRLILTESIIDAASLQQIEEVQKEFSILALYGTNGLTAEHLQAIKNLENLEEVVLFLDGDEAGEAAIKSVTEVLQKAIPKVTITPISTPKDEDVNSLLVAKGSDF